MFNTDAEDAYIAYRYVHQFIDGNGLVFNIGERVEGYSDFLWIIIISATSKLGIEIPIAGRLLGLFFSILTVLFSYYLGKLLNKGSENSGLITAYLVSVFGIFACYGLSGLEVPLFSFFILSILYCCVKQKWLLSGLITSLAIMTHPDGILIAIGVAVFILLSKAVVSFKLKAMAFSLLGFLILFLPWTIWRIEYYGYLLPNAMAAKKGLPFALELKHGKNYLFSFFRMYWPISLLLFGAALVFFRSLFMKKSKISPELGFLSIILILNILFVLFVGGDWMPQWRFISPFAPVIILLIVYFIPDNVKNNTGSIISNVIILTISFIGLLIFTISFKFNGIPRVRIWTNSTNGLKFIGKWFHNTLPPKTCIAVFCNGALSYYDELPTIDMLGLTDEHISRFGHKALKGAPGHVSFDYEYVVNKHPAIIAFLGGSGFQKSTDPNLNKDPVFAQYANISYIYEKSNNPCGKYINLLILKRDKAAITNYLSSQKEMILIKDDQ